MIVTRDEKLEALLLDELVASFSRPLPKVVLPLEGQLRGEEIHLSDILKVRQAFWSRALPLSPTRVEALNFTTGRAHEEILQRRIKLAGWTLGARRYKEGIQYRPDVDWDSFPTEFKTRIRNLARPGEETVTYDGYLEQLQGYCALDGNPLGRLLVLSLAEGMDINNNRVPTHRELAAYRVEYSPYDMEYMLGYIREQRDALIAARKSKDASTLRLCPEWMCGKLMKDMARTVQARCTHPGCDVKHRIEKPGHEMIPEIAAWSYEPRCKWKVFCRPELMDPTRQTR